MTITQRIAQRLFRKANFGEHRFDFPFGPRKSVAGVWSLSCERCRRELQILPLPHSRPTPQRQAEGMVVTDAALGNVIITGSASSQKGCVYAND